MKLLICMLALCGIMGSSVPAMCAENGQEPEFGTEMVDQCTIMIVDSDTELGKILQVDQVDYGTAYELDDYNPGDGKIFKGWYTEPDGKGERWYSGSIVTENLKLYPYVTDAAEETEAPDQCTIMVVNGDNESENIICVDQVDYGTAYELDDYDPGEGKVFNGWYTEPDGKGERWYSGSIVTENLKLYPYVTDAAEETPDQGEKTYSVVFISEDKEYSSFVTDESDGKLKLPEDPSKAGYKFSGWYTEPDGKGIKAESGSDITEDVTLYAYYTNKSYGSASDGAVSAPAASAEPEATPEPYAAPRPEFITSEGPVNTEIELPLWGQNDVDIDIVIVTNGMKIYVNGQEVYFDEAVPFVDEHGNTYAPVRPFAQILGFEVEWDEYNMVALLRKGDSVISLDTVSGMLHRNGVLMKRYVGARRVDGTTYVFVRALAEAEGYKVEYVTEDEYSPVM